ncbi:MAG: hypothetical protein HRU75_14850 [Planctomycetia bacterium]|nr:MAG: hypothetical protein HRU75_14850 [Planctomycetia bacterium]
MKRPARSRTRPAADARPFPWMQVLRCTVWLGALGLAAAGAQALESRYRSLAGERQLYVEWVNPPDWLGADTWRFVLEDLQLGLAPLTAIGTEDPDLARRAATIVSASPWVRVVQRVSLAADGVLRVDAEFRRPLALVLDDTAAYPVAADGVHLPLRGYRLSHDDAAASGYFLISGIAQQAPEPGGTWGAPELFNALRLVSFFERHDWTRGPLAGLRRAFNRVDAARHPGCVSRCLRLRSAEGALIEWGLPPGEESGVEAPAADKFARLTSLARAGLPTDRVVDLRGFDAVIFRLLTPDRGLQPAR